jgi:E3 ubiquitin-protein ligase synoviolin
MTIFRQDFTVGFFAAFVILSFVKIFHWMIQDRVDFIETTPNVTRSQHIRIVAFIFLLIGIDYLLLHYALASTLSKGVSINLLFAFEYAIQISTAVTTLCKYTLSVIDMAMEGRWDGKGVAVFYLELALDLLHLITYTAFFAAVFTTYGIPIHLVRDLYWTFRNFQTRVRDFLRYSRVAAIMEHRFPDASAEDLARADHVCIVCREDMGPGSRAKKLDCSHCFHVHCLRSWLERQQNCPICRAPVLAAVGTSTRRNRQEGGAGDVQAGAAAAQNNNNVNNNGQGGAAAAAGAGGARGNEHDNDRMFDLHALLGLDDGFMEGAPLPAGGQAAGGAAAADTGLRWRGPQQQQQNGNENAAGGEQNPHGMYPYNNMMHPQQQQQQQYPYGYPYTPPPAFPFPPQWQQQQPQQQQQVPTNGSPSAVPASPPPQQQQPQNFAAGAQQQQPPFMSPSFYPIPVFIPMMASPGPHPLTPGAQQQQQQHVTPEQHAMAVALAAAATAAATMSMPFIMPSPQHTAAPIPVYVPPPNNASGSENSASTALPVVEKREQTEVAPSLPPPSPPPQEDAAAAVTSSAPPAPSTNSTSQSSAPVVNNNEENEAEQIRRRRLERFQNGA